MSELTEWVDEPGPCCKDITKEQYYEWEITEYIDSKYRFPYGNLMSDFMWRDMGHFMKTRGNEWLRWKMGDKN